MKTILTTVMACALAFPQTPKKAVIQKFGEGDLQVIKTQVTLSTLIVFPEGEELAEVTCGDKEWWVIEGKGRFVHVKPSKQGLQTNLNVILKSDHVYSFLLKEISKPGATKPKDAADVKVVVQADLDETAQLRKQNENLQDLVLKNEHELRSLRDEREGGKKEAQKKSADEPPPVKPVEVLVTPKNEPAAQQQKPALEVPATVPPPTAVEATIAPTPVPPSAAAEEPTFTTVHVERREGILVSGGRFLGRFFRKVGRTLRLY